MTTTAPKGLLLDVARTKYRSGKGTSLTETHDSVTLVGIVTNYGRTVETLPAGQVFTADETRPAVLMGEITGAVHLKPAVFNTVSGQWEVAPGTWAAGGHFATTSDSRLGDATSRLTGARFYGAIAVHDLDLFPAR